MKREVKEFILIALLCMAKHDMMAVDTKCMITGTVVERRTLEPFAGIDVLLDGMPAARTNTRGEFVIKNVSAGDHKVAAKVASWGTFGIRHRCSATSSNDVRIVVWPTARIGINGVLAHYSLDGNSIDDGPNGWHGTNLGGVACDDRFGICDKAMLFPSQLSRVEIDPHERMIEQPFSVSFWVRIDSSCYAACIILGRHHQTCRDSWSINLVSERVSCDWIEETAWHHISANPSIVVRDGRWHHIAYIVGEGSSVLFIDNVLCEETSVTARNVPKTPDTRPFLIGGATYVTPHERSFKGSIDDLYFFDRIISDEERLILARGW